ncbi:protein of unknown function (DUF4349) [Fragilaria crotonensis]|nr:protein of unknown function (DUF4349) [Fragilaria crotonensis]
MSSDNGKLKQKKRIMVSRHSMMAMVALLLFAFSSTMVLSDRSDSSAPKWSQRSMAASSAASSAGEAKHRFYEGAAVGHVVSTERNAIAEDEGETLGEVVSQSMNMFINEVKDINPPSRMLVHTGHLSAISKQGDLFSIANKIEEMIEKDGGYVESKNSYRDVYPGLLGSDMVQSLSINSQDVTDSFIDASSRAETLAACRKAIQVLLQKAQNVQEVMEVQRELNRLTQEYESHKSRAESLRKQSSLSILTINLMEQQETEADYDSAPGFYPVLIAFKAMNDVLVAFKITLEIFYVLRSFGRHCLCSSICLLLGLYLSVEEAPAQPWLV